MCAGCVVKTVRLDFYQAAASAAGPASLTSILPASASTVKTRFLRNDMPRTTSDGPGNSRCPEPA